MACDLEDALNWLRKHLWLLKCETCIADNEVSKLVEENSGSLGFSDGALHFCEMVYSRNWDVIRKEARSTFLSKTDLAVLIRFQHPTRYSKTDREGREASTETYSRSSLRVQGSQSPFRYGKQMRHRTTVTAVKGTTRRVTYDMA